MPIEAAQTAREGLVEGRQDRRLTSTSACGSGDGDGDHHDLDFMIGSLSKREADNIDREIASQRRIDPDLWR